MTIIDAYGGSELTTELLSILDCSTIQPGSQIGYQACKTIYLYHPLGRKMVEAPLTMAQSQEREIAVQESPPETVEAFKAQWEADEADKVIHNYYRIARIYGIGTLVAVCDKVPPKEPFDMARLWELPLVFNVLDPLNTAGSLVLSQIPTSPDFQRPVTVRANGQEFHPSRFIVAMNEEPIFISYTVSAFGFVGRSVYSRAVYPLKTFIQSMRTDDMMTVKAGVMVAKMKSPGSVINKMMTSLAAMKRNLLKDAQTGNVLQIDTEESIETLNMQNAEAAAGYARGNALKNIATAADMPAKMLENETMVAGFGEGTEDAKNIAAYIDSIRADMRPAYKWFDNLIMYRAWNPEFYKRIQSKYPEQYGGVEYTDAFSRWRQNFQAVWPSVLREPDSEKEKSEKTKLDAVMEVLGVLLDKVDPLNKVKLIQAALDNISENKHMFQHEFELDYPALLDYLETQHDNQQKSQEMSLENPDVEKPSARAQA